MANSTDGLVNWWMPIYTLYEVLLHTLSFHSPHEKPFGVTSPDATIRSSMEKSVARSPNSRYKWRYAQRVPRYSGKPWDGIASILGSALASLSCFEGVWESWKSWIVGRLRGTVWSLSSISGKTVRPAKKVPWPLWLFWSFCSKEKHIWVWRHNITQQCHGWRARTQVDLHLTNDDSPKTWMRRVQSADSKVLQLFLGSLCRSKGREVLMPAQPAANSAKQRVKFELWWLLCMLWFFRVFGKRKTKVWNV